MKNISIAYNPYLVTTAIKIDGQTPPEGTDFVQLTTGRRLQDWIDSFLSKIFQKYRVNDLSFDFYGTRQNAEDLKQAIVKFNQDGHRFRVDKIQESELGKNPLEDLKVLYEKGKDGPFADIFNSPQMKNAFERAISPEFEVNVVATMSSGKSTLVNALLGKELMPSKNEACTATIATIEDCDSQSEFTAIRYDASGKPLTAKAELATRELLTEWNKDVVTSRIEIKGNIPTVDETKDSKYVFVDTPGPNNSRNEEHKRTTYEAIQSKPLSMIIYVQNATNFGVNDDDNLLREVSKAMSEGDRQAQDRFIFVVNKIDEFNQGEDSVKETLGHVQQYLQKHGIKNPVIIPVSALLAKLVRLKKFFPSEMNADSEDQLYLMKRKFLRNQDLNLFQYSKTVVNSEIIHRLENQLANSSDDDDKALIYSGVPVLEELLKDFLYRHALPAKLKDAVDSFDRVMRDYTKTLNLNKILQEKDSEIKKIAEHLQNSLSRKASLDQADKFKQEIQEISFTMSNETKKKLAVIKEEEDEVIERLKNRLDRGNVSEYEAKELALKAENDCKDFDIDVGVILRKAFKTETVFQLNQLRNRYVTYITSILHQTFPDNETARELQLSVMEMPNADEMISDNTRTEYYEVKVERSRWNPLRWFGSKYSTEEREREVVDLDPIYKEFASNIRDFSMKNLRSFTKICKKELEQSKELLSTLMDAKNEELKELTAEMAAASKDKEKKEAMKREAEAKQMWYSEFQKNLKAILAI